MHLYTPKQFPPVRRADTITRSNVAIFAANSGSTELTAEDVAREFAGHGRYGGEPRHVRRAEKCLN